MFIRRFGWVVWIGCLSLLEATTVSAALPSVTLAWNPSPANNIAGYRLYLGLSSGTYATSLDVGATTNATLANLTPGMTYYFAVTAYDTNNLESPFSGEINYTIPGVVNLAKLRISRGPTGQVQITGSAPVGYSYSVLSSKDLKNWNIVGTVVADTSGSFLFLDTIRAGTGYFYRVRQISP
jgi:hypothetical protein